MSSLHCMAHFKTCLLHCVHVYPTLYCVGGSRDWQQTWSQERMSQRLMLVCLFYWLLYLSFSFCSYVLSAEHIYTHAHTHTHACTHTHTLTHTHAYIHAQHTHKHMHTYMYMDTHVSTCTHTHTHTLTHTHTHTYIHAQHTHTHTHTIELFGIRCSWWRLGLISSLSCQW